MKKILLISMMILFCASFSNVKTDGINELEKNSNQLMRELENQRNIEKYKEIENINYREKQVNIENEVAQSTSLFFIDKITYIDDDKLLNENEKYLISSFFEYRELGL